MAPASGIGRGGGDDEQEEAAPQRVGNGSDDADDALRNCAAVSRAAGTREHVRRDDLLRAPSPHY